MGFGILVRIRGAEPVVLEEPTPLDAMSEGRGVYGWGSETTEPLPDGGTEVPEEGSPPV